MCKFFGPKIWWCNFFDKSQVWFNRVSQKKTFRLANPYENLWPLCTILDHVRSFWTKWSRIVQNGPNFSYGFANLKFQFFWTPYRVLKMVLGTYYYLYLWHYMANCTEILRPCHINSLRPCHIKSLDACEQKIMNTAQQNIGGKYWINDETLV